MTNGWLYLIGTAFAVFFAVLLATKPSRRLADGILSAWLLVIALHLLDHYALRVGLKVRYPHLLGLGDGLALLYGPSLFLYVRFLAWPDRRLSGREALHILPFIAYTVISGPFYLSPGSEKPGLWAAGMTSMPYFEPLAIAAKLGSLPVYLVFVFREIRRFEARTEQYCAGSEPRSLEWLHHVSVAMVIFWLVIIGAVAAESIGGVSLPGGEADGFIFTAVVLGVIALGYLGFRQGTVFDFSSTGALPTESMLQGEARDAGGDAGRYRRSGLTAENARLHLARLRDLMEAEKLYLDSEFSIEEAAGRIGVSRHHLTQALNEHSGKNFYMYVNEYRVREACRRMVDPGNAERTALAIGLDSGFNSKSAFNAAFKRYTSMTPSEYRKARVGRS